MCVCVCVCVCVCMYVCVCVCVCMCVARACVCMLQWCHNIGLQYLLYGPVQIGKVNSSKTIDSYL